MTLTAFTSIAIDQHALGAYFRGFFSSLGGVILESTYFCDFGVIAKLQNPMISPHAILATTVIRTKRKEKYQNNGYIRSFC